MQDTITANELIETKFYRPGLPVDMVYRPRLTNYLKKRQVSRPLTLVSAPAGYGKSTLVSYWFEQVDCSKAWLSLEEKDNDLENFTRYFVAAIQKVFPNKLCETDSLLNNIALSPTVAVIASTLINEIHQIGELLFMVLDDYHVIKETEIHDLLDVILLHPPPNLHLVISTRVDPPLSLTTLRGKGLLSEVRIPSLRFSKDESLHLFKKMTGTSSIDEDILSEIEAKSEGWVTGLRLAALAMRHRVGREVFDLKFTVNNRYVSEYLLSEILAKQAAQFSDCMLKTSIPSRFNAELCEALCFEGTDSSSAGSAWSDFNGYQFLEWLRTSNLFIIPLDDEQKWYRYHHIFREFLQQEQLRRNGPEQVRKLHMIAGRWFADNNLIDEAFYHLFPSGDVSKAIELVAQNRYRMMNATRWSLLENWLTLFQEHTIESSPELWMLKTWLVYHRAQFGGLPALLQKLESILADEPDQKAATRLAGEIHALRSLVAYHSNNGEEAISHALLALEQIPSELWIVRVLARLYLAGGLLMTGGDLSGSYRAIYNAFIEEDVQNNLFRATLLSVVCNLHWLVGDLHGLKQAAEESIALCRAENIQQILRNSCDSLGKVKYEQNDLPGAEELFTSITAKTYLNYGTSYVNSVCGLGMTYQAMGKEAKARQVIGEAIAFLLETGNITQLPIIQALDAELALKQGNLAAAQKWAEKLDPVPPLLPIYGFLSPHLTLVRILLAEDTPQSRAKAGELLTELQNYFESTHNTRFLIETLATQALLTQALADQPAALKKLTEALRLAQAGGFIRIFVDAGPEMARLLSQLEVDNDLRDYVGKIRAAFSGLQQTHRAFQQGGLLDPLTDREMQVLKFLQKRMSNKEIAAELVVSAGTVKGHTIKLYQKLNVNSRRQAVEKAISLGLLIPD